MSVTCHTRRGRYACREGNYEMFTLLSAAARAAEQMADEVAK